MAFALQSLTAFDPVSCQANPMSNLSLSILRFHIVQVSFQILAIVIREQILLSASLVVLQTE